MATRFLHWFPASAFLLIITGLSAHAFAQETPGPTNGDSILREEPNTDPRKETVVADWVARIQHDTDGWTEMIWRREYHRRLIERYGGQYRSSVADPRMLLPKIVESMPLAFLEVEAKHLVEMRLLKHAMKKSDTPIPDEKLDEQLDKIRKETIERYKGDFDVEDILERQGMTFDEFRENLRLDMWLRNRLKKEATGKRLDAFYQKNRLYFTGVRRLIAHIYIEAVPEKEKPIKKKDSRGRVLSAKEIAKRRKARLRKEWGRAQQRVREAISAVKKDGWRPEVVKAYSDDEATRDGGGLLGYVLPRSSRESPLHQAILDAAFRPRSGAIPKSGAGLLVDEPARTDRGYHIVYIYGETPPNKVSLEDIKKLVTDTFLEEQRRKYIDSLKEECTITYRLGPPEDESDEDDESDKDKKK